MTELKPHELSQNESFDFTQPDSPIMKITKFELYKTHSASRIDPRVTTPSFLENHPDLSEESRVEALVYYSTEVPFNQLLAIPLDKLDFREVIFRRNRLSAISKGYVVYPAAERLSETPLPIEDSQIDYTSISRRWMNSVYINRQDRNVCDYFAYLVITHPQLSNIVNLDDLESFVRANGYTGRSESFRAVFERTLIRLVSEKRVNELRGFLSTDEIGVLYQDVISWLKIFAEERVRSPNIRNRETVTPYPLHIGKDDYPSADFLPYAGRALLEFITSLPQLLPEGKPFNITALVQRSKEFFSLCDNVLEGAQLQISQNIQIELNEIKKDFVRMLSFFQKNPGLINKYTPAAQLSGETASMREIRQKILQAGGDIGKVTHFFRTRSRLRLRDL